MKHLTLIIHDKLKSDTADFIRGMEQIEGFTFTSVEGHGGQSQKERFLSMRDKVVGYIPRTRVDILLEDEHVDKFLDELTKSEIGLKGHVVYWTTKVDDFGRI